MSRAHPDIDAKITWTEARLRALYAERDTRDRNNALVAEFAAGKSIAAIASSRKLTYATVQGILWRRGRTSGGRTAIRQAIREAVSQQVAA